jgi:hypothetical protein
LTARVGFITVWSVILATAVDHLAAMSLRSLSISSKRTLPLAVLQERGEGRMVGDAEFGQRPLGPAGGARVLAGEVAGQHVQMLARHLGRSDALGFGELMEPDHAVEPADQLVDAAAPSTALMRDCSTWSIIGLRMRPRCSA